MSENKFGTGTPGVITDSELQKKSFETHTCPICGEEHVPASAAGLEKMLAKIVLSDEAIAKMRSSLENLDFEGYFNQAKDYVGKQSAKARDYAKDNKKTVAAAAVGAVAVAAGLLLARKLRNERLGGDDRDRV
jgi:hypothetical protein